MEEGEKGSVGGGGDMTTPSPTPTTTDSTTTTTATTTTTNTLTPAPTNTSKDTNKITPNLPTGAVNAPATNATRANHPFGRGGAQANAGRGKANSTAKDRHHHGHGHGHGIPAPIPRRDRERYRPDRSKEREKHDKQREMEKEKEREREKERECEQQRERERDKEREHVRERERERERELERERVLEREREQELREERENDNVSDLDDELLEPVPPLFGLRHIDLSANANGTPPLPQLPPPPPPVQNVQCNNQPTADAHILTYNWQASKNTIKDRLAYMFNSDIMSDVHFMVGKGPHTQQIPAHKFVLSIGSAVFDAMFNGGMATTSEEVELPDVEPAAFLALLRFLYSDEVQIGPETVMTTLYTAKKYAVPALERACVDFLKRNLSSDNAFMLLTQARLFDEPQLAALCLETIDKNTTEALAAEGFTDIDLDTLCVVLERDTLGIRECKMFSSVCRWADSECLRQSLHISSDNKRVVLGRALGLIRFPLMTVEEFAVGAAQSGILEDREVVELFLHFTVNPKPSVHFLDSPRCCLTGKEQVVSRFCQIESRWGYSGTSDRIRSESHYSLFPLYGSN